MKTKRTPIEVREDALKRIAAGEKISRLAKEIGVHPSAVYQWKSLAKSVGITKKRKPMVHHELPIEDEYVTLRLPVRVVEKLLSGVKI